MSKSWLHPNRPNVPQPPYNLQSQPDVAPLRQQRPRTSSNAATEQPSELSYTSQPTNSSRARPQDAPPTPRIPTNYASPHHNAYHTAGGVPPKSNAGSPPPQPDQEAAPVNAPLRTMNAEQRAAYIRDVDARALARRAGANGAGLRHNLAGIGTTSPGLRPLQLAQSTLQVRQAVSQSVSPTTAQPAPQALADSHAQLTQYLQDNFADAAEAPDTPTDVAQEDEPVTQPENTAPRAATPAPQDITPPTSPSSSGDESTPAPAATYDNTANQADGSHRVPPTATYEYGKAVLGHSRQPSLTVTPTAPGAAVGPMTVDAANNAVVEIFSNGQVVARISLPYPSGR